MSRWIDAEWLIKESMPLSFSVQKWVNEVQIMTAPSIDIVRCEECKWADKCSQNIAMANTYQMYEKINFCSYGEREGE